MCFLNLIFRRDLGLLFSEEAAKKWTTQTGQWLADRQYRETKFSGLVDNLRELLRIRIQIKDRSLQSCRNSRKSVEEAVERLTLDLQVGPPLVASGKLVVQWGRPYILLTIEQTKSDMEPIL